MRASPTGGCAVVYFTVQYCIEYSSTVSYFKPRMSGSKCENSGDVAGTARKHQAIMMETNVKIIDRMEQQEEKEVTEVPKN